jgi:hypothetical protein
MHTTDIHLTDIHLSEEHLFDDMLAENGFPPATTDTPSLRRELEAYAVWAVLLLACFGVWCLVVWGVWAAIR